MFSYIESATDVSFWKLLYKKILMGIKVGIQDSGQIPKVLGFYCVNQEELF